VLTVTIDRNRIEPPYLQLAMILESKITSGALGPGARVPSITDLKGTYDVGKNTAIRALRELRDKGLVEVRPGWGTFVKAPQALRSRTRPRCEISHRGRLRLDSLSTVGLANGDACCCLPSGFPD
jgi:DNA-binding GntR family transcriptional regulator